MVTALLGRKIGMTQVYDEAGAVSAVTILEVGPCDVVQIKTPESDGYRAVQIAFGDMKEKRTTQPMLGHLKKAGVGPRRIVREVPLAGPETPAVGQALTVDLFKAGQVIDVIGTTRGMGYTGTMKRYHFGGGRASHGSIVHRHGGTISPKVHKGIRMAGHHGNMRRTVKNVKVMRVDAAENLLLVQGAVPGARNSFVVVRRATSARVIRGKPPESPKAKARTK